MSTLTPNYNLIKPDSSDPFGDFRSDYNDNLDIIDANLGGGGGASTLAGLSDVDINSPADGEVLTYDGNSSKWKNATPSSGGDSVSWTQLQSTGTKIAEIDINGTTTNVYAPSGGGGGGSQNYSTTEQVVGSWIDARPVYQKSFVSTSGLSSYQAISHGISALDDLVKAECVLRSSDKSWQVPMTTDQYNAELEITPSEIRIYLNNDFVNASTGGYFITLQYTKNTD